MKKKEKNKQTVTKVSALHHCDSPSNKYSCVLLTCVGCAVPAKFLMDKDFSGCIYTIDGVNLIDLDIMCSCHLASS